MAKKKKGSSAVTWLIGIGVLAAAAGLFLLFGPNTGAFSDGEYFYIRTGTGYEDVKRTLKEEGFIRQVWSFDLLAKKAGYPEHVGPGKYHITPGMSNYQIVKMLRAHRQTPVRLVIKKMRLRKDFIDQLSDNLEPSDVQFKSLLDSNGFWKEYGLDSNTSFCAVVPDTYEFYWNTTTEAALRKIARNYKKFWTEARKAQAKKADLTQAQAVIIASIVDEETNNNAEKPNVASVYLNRFRKGIKLQADPTARFAFGDFSIRRITQTQTSFVSPYNTYQVKGLPPGPICTPSLASVQAVLDAPSTNYLFFCAKGDGSGTHSFASNYADHLKNARAFHEVLDKRGVH